MARTEPRSPFPEDLTDTQRRILGAALETFAEKGFAGASTAEIARRAGVAEKTLFAQFKSKQALLERTLTPGVIALVEPRIVEGLREVAQGTHGKSLATVLTAFMSDRLAIVREHPKVLKLVAHELLLRGAVRKTLTAAFQEHIAPQLGGAIADLVQRGQLRTDLPPRTVLRTMISVTVGFALSRYVLELEPGVDEREELARIVELLVHGLAPRAGASG
jgi:AcrR family transcriptional regulator